MTMTKSELAAQKCADMGNEVSRERKYYSNYKAVHFAEGSIGSSSIAFRRFVEHVSDLCEHAIASGDTKRVYIFELARQENYSGEHREWTESVTVPSAVVSRIIRDATSGLEELVLREPVDPDLLEARVIVANAAVLRTDNQRQAILDGHAGLLQVNAALAGLRRGREIERGEGK